MEKRLLFYEIEPYFSHKNAIIVNGMRQVGKTTLLRQIYEEIQLPKLWFDFDNPLEQLYFENLDYRSIYSRLLELAGNSELRLHVFIDEIQNYPPVTKVIKYLIDHYNVKFFVTGSAQFYLKNLFPESLSGRKLLFDLKPMSFREILYFKHLVSRDEISFDIKRISKLKNDITIVKPLENLYEIYLEFGGFPEVVMTEDSDVEVQPAIEAYEAVLEWAGALHPQRDAVDIRVLEEVADSTGHIIDCVQQGPIVLDEGIANSATTTSIVYSVVDDAIKYSAEGRQVRILSGAGAGQMRIGVAMNTLDAENQIVEAVVDSPWDVVPDATSQFSITTLCANSLGGFPKYATGTPYLDEDNDGMDDAWEHANGLNPSDANDRNGTGLDAGGYTNLEVYLNGYYADQPTGLQDAELAQSAFELKAYPNPFNGSIALAVIGATQLKAQIFDVNGKQIRLLEGSNPLLWNGYHANQSKAAAGIYFVHLTVKNTVLRTKVILTE
jgi:dihydroxyacetone kinase DhaKLM complex PTS-EIIA-like component DhaM